MITRAGSTSNIVLVFIEDSASAGNGKTGLVFNSAGQTAYYKRDVGTASVVITLVTATLGTFTSSGFKEVDATNMPGVYEVGIPDAAVAAGALSCVIEIKGASNAWPVIIEIDLRTPDTLFNATMTEGYAADGAAATLAQLMHMVWNGIAEVSVSGTTLTVKKLDGSTTAMTFTLNSASAPTSRTRAT
jgi:hypothetical protein